MLSVVRENFVINLAYIKSLNPIGSLIPEPYGVRESLEAIDMLGSWRNCWKKGRRLGQTELKGRLD